MVQPYISDLEYTALVTELRTALERERSRADAAEQAREQARQEAETAKIEAAELRGKLAAHYRPGWLARLFKGGT